MAAHDHNHRSGFGNEDVLEQMLANKQAIWEGAYQTLISSGKAVKIPLDMGQTFLVTDKQKKEIVPFRALNYLFMYKDSAQQIHTEWVKLFPDKDWLYGNRSEYYGIVEVKDWNGKLIRRLNHSKSPSTGSSQNMNSIVRQSENDLWGNKNSSI